MNKFQTKEHWEKATRINDMREEGFNIPRQAYLSPRALGGDTDLVMKWAKDICDSKPDQLFNIRTYRYIEKSQKEEQACPHLCDIPYGDLLSYLTNYTQHYTCMIDAETPDLGRMAGTIVIIQDYASKDCGVEVEFVSKDHRAMVRDINSEKGVKSLEVKTKTLLDLSTFYHSEVWRLQFPDYLEENEAVVLASLIQSPLRFYKKNLIFEWTYFAEPSGIYFNSFSHIYPVNHIVWWEYRNRR